MTQEHEKYDLQFYQLVISLHASAMHQMGKVASPLTGKIERDLTMAQSSIDMLEMLQRKSQGNLNDDEKKLLDHVLYELRINYLDEAKKGDSPPETGSDADTANQQPPEQKAEEPPASEAAETENTADKEE